MEAQDKFYEEDKALRESLISIFESSEGVKKNTVQKDAITITAVQKISNPKLIEVKGYYELQDPNNYMTFLTNLFVYVSSVPSISTEKTNKIAGYSVPQF